MNPFPIDFMEKRFQLNLTRLAGVTNAIAIDHMLETISYITSHSIHEARFIEEKYLGMLFEDENLQQYGVYTLEGLATTFEEAKKHDDVEFLKCFKIAHRKSRSFLEDVEIKKLLKDIVLQRANDVERNCCFNVFAMMLQLIQNFPEGKFPQHLAKLLPEMSKHLPGLYDSGVEKEEEIINNSAKPDSGKLNES